jgi:protein-disulfide isomerase
VDLKFMRITRLQPCALAATLACSGLIASGELWSRGPSFVQSARSEATSVNSQLAAAGRLGDEVEGNPHATVTIIEYASMTCPHCASFAVNDYPVLRSRYIDTGKVRYILRPFPLDPLSAAALMLARCAGHDKYYAMVDTLFRSQKRWLVPKPLPALLEIAKQAGFTQTSFDACLSNQKLLDGIDWVREHAADKFGVDSTPTFFINSTMHRGDMTLSELEASSSPISTAD